MTTLSLGIRALVRRRAALGPVTPDPGAVAAADAEQVAEHLATVIGEVLALVDAIDTGRLTRVVADSMGTISALQILVGALSEAARQDRTVDPEQVRAALWAQIGTTLAVVELRKAMP